MPEEVKAQGIPPTPPPWWPRYWPWPPFTEPYYANVKRTYDFSESLGNEKDWEHRARVRRYEHGEAKAEEDTRAAEKALQDVRLKFSDALWATALKQMNDIHAITLQIIADNLADARVSRAVAYNLQFIKGSEMEALKKAQEMTEVALKELLGPPRGGVTPATGKKE